MVADMNAAVENYKADIERMSRAVESMPKDILVYMNMVIQEFPHLKSKENRATLVSVFSKLMEKTPAVITTKTVHNFETYLALMACVQLHDISSPGQIIIVDIPPESLPWFERNMAVMNSAQVNVISMFKEETEESGRLRAAASLAASEITDRYAPEDMGMFLNEIFMETVMGLDFSEDSEDRQYLGAPMVVKRSDGSMTKIHTSTFIEGCGAMYMNRVPDEDDEARRRTPSMILVVTDREKFPYYNVKWSDSARLSVFSFGAWWDMSTAIEHPHAMLAINPEDRAALIGGTNAAWRKFQRYDAWENQTHMGTSPENEYDQIARERAEFMDAYRAADDPSSVEVPASFAPYIEEFGPVDWDVAVNREKPAFDENRMLRYMSWRINNLSEEDVRVQRPPLIGRPNVFPVVFHPLGHGGCEGARKIRRELPAKIVEDKLWHKNSFHHSSKKKARNARMARRMNKIRSARKKDRRQDDVSESDTGPSGRERSMEKKAAYDAAKKKRQEREERMARWKSSKAYKKATKAWKTQHAEYRSRKDDRETKRVEIEFHFRSRLENWKEFWKAVPAQLDQQVVDAMEAERAAVEEEVETEDEFPTLEEWHRATDEGVISEEEDDDSESEGEEDTKFSEIREQLDAVRSDVNTKDSVTVNLATVTPLADETEK